MPFPYLAPVKEWVVKILKEREYSTQLTDITSPTSINNNFNSVLKMPFAVLTSGAKVTNVTGYKTLDAKARAKELAKLYANNDADSKDYLGCIIRNDLDIKAKYQLEESYIGVDFAGKKIKVVGESNRRISTPIIENIEIDTDGANNTLKTATVTVRCFSLKQFEMFELFFCRPGMNVLVEFGDNTLDTYRFKDKKPAEAYSNSSYVSSLLFPKTDYQKFIDVFSSYYRFTNLSFKQFQLHVAKSLGSYDFVAGKVTNYSFGIEADGTYNVSLTISQGNQMSLAIPVNIGNTDSKVPANSKKEVPTFQQWISQLVADLSISKDRLNVEENDWKNEFFNWDKVNNTKQDETASDERYISLRFILEILMNYVLSDKGYEKDTFLFPIPKYDVGGSQKPYIPIRSHKSIISSTTDILYPNKKMVTFRGPIAKNGEADTIQISDATIDCSINGYSVNEGVVVKDENGNIINQETTDGGCCGNALNIFINYKTLVQSWKSASTRMEFLGAILDVINANSYGKFRLVRANHKEGVSASILDYTGQSSVKIDEEIYRFNVNTLNSNVIDFSFNFEMSNLVAGRTVFNAQRFLAKALTKLTPEQKGLESIPLPSDIFEEFDNSMMSNADGFFSLNMIDLKALQANLKDSVKTATTPPDETPAEPNQAKNYSEIIDSKCIKFKFKDGIKLAIFTDKDTIKSKISDVKDELKSTLSPIQITIVLDGINGFNCGEYFRINGVPEIYNQIGVFQITNTKHSISPDGWRTTLEAQFRITPKQ